MNAQLQQLVDWGYVLAPSHQFDGATVYHVAGFGTAQHVREDDTNTLTALTDPDAHAERVQQQDESPEQTQARWVREGRAPAPYPAETE